MATVIFQAFLVTSAVTCGLVTLAGWLRGGSPECWCGQLATRRAGECADHGGDR
jgi:hypothetical protein